MQQENDGYYSEEEVFLAQEDVAEAYDLEHEGIMQEDELGDDHEPMDGEHIEFKDDSIQGFFMHKGFLELS